MNAMVDISADRNKHGKHATSSPSMSKIAIIGAGMMGSALAFPARENGNEVNLVGTPLDRDIIDAVRATGRHPKFDADFPAGVSAFQFEEMEKAIEGADLVIGGVSSFGVDWFGEHVLPRIPRDTPVLSVTKGLADLPDGTLLTYPEVWRRRLAAKGVFRDVYAIGGPCTSYELVAHDQTEVAFCGPDISVLRRIRAMMETPYYHVSLSTDTTGIESAVALKNGYALGIALTIGLNQRERGLESPLHFNSQAAVFGQAVKEMARLLSLQGARTLENLCVGAGDLYVTVYGGRTRLVGILLGRGLTIDEARKELAGVTLESLVVAERVSRAVKARIAAGALRAEDFPLLLHIDRLLSGKGDAALPWDAFRFEPDSRPAGMATESAPVREHPLILAHRGGRLEYDDNAAGAFADALARGIRGAETDVRMTKDQHLVIMHDPTVDRTTDGTGAVADMTLAEIKQLRLKRCGERVPTFSELCGIWRGRDDLDIEFELKLHAEDTTPELIDTYIRKIHNEAAAILNPKIYGFTSFSVGTLRRFRELYPDARLGLICGELSERNIALAASLGCFRIAPNWDGATGPMAVAKAHATGLSVNLWCSNAPTTYDIVKAWGADVSTSDFPRAIRGHAIGTGPWA